MYKNSGLFLIALLAGCTNTPVAQIVWPVSPSQAPATQRPALAVTFEDVRPAWERHSRKCAVDFRAMEDCEAPPWNVLTSAVQHEAASWRQRPASAAVRLSSFRVIIKKNRKEWNPDFWLPKWPSGGSSNSGFAVLGVIGVIGAIAAVEGAVIVSKALADEVIRSRREHRGPPFDLADKYSTGVTCEIKATVVLLWPDGRKRESEVSAVVNSDTDQGAAERVCEIHETLQQAMGQLANDWKKKNATASNRD